MIFRGNYPYFRKPPISESSENEQKKGTGGLFFPCFFFLLFGEFEGEGMINEGYLVAMLDSHDFPFLEMILVGGSWLP